MGLDTAGRSAQVRVKCAIDGAMFTQRPLDIVHDPSIDTEAPVERSPTAWSSSNVSTGHTDSAVVPDGAEELYGHG